MKYDKYCTRITAPEWLTKNRRCTGSWKYNKGDYQNWHTNWQNPGARVYVVWSENGDSGMRFIINGRVQTFKDIVGWQYRIFNVPQPHCVWANCKRISYGFRIDKVDQELLNAVGLKNAEDILSIT